jgi:hypothetical protein
MADWVNGLEVGREEANRERADHGAAHLQDQAPDRLELVVEAGLHAFEASINPFETSFHFDPLNTELGFDAIEALVDLIEAAIDLIEAKVDVAPEVIEPIVSPAFSHRLHVATLADKKLRRVKGCARMCDKTVCRNQRPVLGLIPAHTKRRAALISSVGSTRPARSCSSAAALGRRPVKQSRRIAVGAGRARAPRRLAEDAGKKADRFDDRRSSHTCEFQFVLPFDQVFGVYARDWLLAEAWKDVLPIDGNIALSRLGGMASICAGLPYLRHEAGEGVTGGFLVVPAHGSISTRRCSRRSG